MEEIGHRTTKFTFEGLGDEARAYLDWLIKGFCGRTPKFDQSGHSP
jgi:hypothetical protein